MEYWLKYSATDCLRLPVIPSSFEIARGNNNTTVTVQNTGELNLIGKSKLASIPVSSFFPAKEYSFCQYTGFPAPYNCVAMIERWRKSGKPIQLIVTQTDINMAVTIENFNYGEQDGTGDVYFTLELKEYRYVSVPTIKATASSAKKPAARPTKTPSKSYTVKKGDTLYSIAKKTTGKGSNHKAIAKKNGLKNPEKIRVGQRILMSW